MNFWKEINRPIKVLAPMAGYTDAAFRLLCKDFGADVTMSELVSADAIAYAKIKNQKLKIKINEKEYTLNRLIASKNQPTADLLTFFEEERPFVVQLFGKNPENFARAARWITDELKPDGIDINMGCPARKVVGSDHGAALLKTPELAREIIEAVVGNTDLPVSVKTRLGWDNDDQILEFAPMVQRAGASAIIIHGRTYKDGFSGKARWGNIYETKNIVKDGLVVIGNGDIGRLDNGMHRPYAPSHGGEEAQLDGYAIGRASFGKPWIFKQGLSSKNKELREEGQELGLELRDRNYELGEIDIEELKKVILKHAMLAQTTKGEHGIVEFRKQLLAYFAGFPGAKEMRKQAVSIVSFDDVKRLVENFETL